MRRYQRVLISVTFPLLASLSGCSVWMEAQRPTPVDPHKFVVGESRIDVVESLGNPVSTLQDPAGDTCDIYRLYTRGPNAAEKTGIAVGEGAADVATLGLSEILFTPAEGATKNAKHPVTFCYKDAKLVSVTVGHA